MNIVLIGYRGTGKSTVAKILSRRLKRRLYNVDALIVKSVGMSIRNVVDTFGWPRFREIESSIIREVSNDCLIIDCGGGVVLNPQNIQHLRKNGKIVLLTADFQTILNRIIKDPNRPPLKNGLSFEDEQRQVFAERKSKYLAAADMVCDTTQTPSEVTSDKIIYFFNEKSWV